MKFEYHVKPTGSDAACGDAEHPFATISKAAQMASPGDTVIVHEGAYREQVDPKRGGLSEHERITYCGAEGEARPVIKGSECVRGWTELADHPHVWTVMLDNTMFGDFNPFATPIFGDWLEMPKFGKDPDKHLGDVYLNGVSFFESTTLEGVYDPQPRDTDEDFALKIPCPVPDVDRTRYVWHAEVDENAGTTTIWRISKVPIRMRNWWRSVFVAHASSLPATMSTTSPCVALKWRRPLEIGRRLPRSSGA